MLTPIVLQIIFWFGVLAFIGTGVYIIVDEQAGKQFLGDHVTALIQPEYKLYIGLLLIIGGPFVLRLSFELLMLPFTINNTLTDIRRGLIKAEQERRGPGRSETQAAHNAPLDPSPGRMRR